MIVISNSVGAQYLFISAHTHTLGQSILASCFTDNDFASRFGFCRDIEDQQSKKKKKKKRHLFSLADHCARPAVDCVPLFSPALVCSLRLERDYAIALNQSFFPRVCLPTSFAFLYLQDKLWRRRRSYYYEWRVKKWMIKGQEKSPQIGVQKFSLFFFFTTVAGRQKEPERGFCVLPGPG